MIKPIKQIVVFILVLLISACSSKSELKQVQDEINQLKVELEVLTNKTRLLDGTAVTNENLVTLKKHIDIDLLVVEKRSITVTDASGYPYDGFLVFGLADTENNSPISITIGSELYEQLDVGKRYRFSCYGIFVYENEDEHFRYEFAASSAEKIIE